MRKLHNKNSAYAIARATGDGLAVIIRCVSKSSPLHMHSGFGDRKVALSYESYGP